MAVFGLAAAGGFVATWLAQRYLVPVDGPSSQFGVLIVKQISLTNLPVEGNLVRVEVAFTNPGTAVLRKVRQSMVVESSEAGQFRPDCELMLAKLGRQQGSDPLNADSSAR